MKQIYHHYKKWECVKAGMWQKVPIEKENEMLQKAIEFTSDYKKYGASMMKAVKEWKYSTEHHLTDKSINRKAYIGHAGVCIELGIPEYITRMAWHYLTKTQQDLANIMADKAIEQFELKKHKIYAKTLFTD